MPSSKIPFWDLDAFFTKELNESSLVGVSCSDLLVYDFFLRPSRLYQGKKPRIFSGKEVKIDFLETNLQGPGLFQEEFYWWIHGAEFLDKDCQSRIFEWSKGLETNDRIVLIHKKSLKTPYDVTSIRPPAFWEGGKFLSYICRIEEVSLGPIIQEKLLSLYSQSFEKLYLAVLQLKGLYGRQHLNSLQNLEHVSQTLEMDMFKLADIFNQGRLKDFLMRIESFQNIEELRKICFFFQRHIEKAMAPDHLRNKDRLSQYDKGILMAHNQLGDKLKNWLNFFIDLELQSKMNPQRVQDEIRLQMWV
jgi:hypothetical protein